MNGLYSVDPAVREECYQNAQQWLRDKGGSLTVEDNIHNGTVVTVCSQCPQGTVSLGAYEVSGALKRAGAVSGHDLTTEAAVAKLYYLFSRFADVDAVKAAMELDLRGEMIIQK